MTADTTLLQPARLLDFTAGPVLNLIDGRGWRDLDERDRIGASYGFVRDEIHFGYNRGATSRRPLDCHVVLTEDGWTRIGAVKGREQERAEGGVRHHPFQPRV